METIGHKLMAYRVDEQLLGILHAQFESAIEKLGMVGTFKLEGQAAIEILYYLISIGLPSTFEMSYATPGMQAVGLAVEHTPQIGRWSNHWAHVVMVVSFLSVKWSLLKMQEISLIDRWSSYPEVYSIG